MKSYIKACCLAAAVVLVSCGGGGGGGGGGGAPPEPPPEPPPVTPPVTPVDTGPGSEFSRSHGLAAINAEAAYNAGITGNGVVLGQIDTGVYWAGSDSNARLHSDLQGRIITSSAHANARVSGALPNADDVGHGLATAGMMVARRNDNSGIQGVAPGARLRFLAMGLGRAAPIYRPVTLSPSLDFNSDLVTRLTGTDVLAVNNSWGTPGLISRYQESDIRANMPNFLRELAQAGTVAANRKIWVWAAGNAHGRTRSNGEIVNANIPELLPGLPLRVAELRGHSLAVASVDNSGVISSFSNRCGAASAFCLAAPGEVGGGTQRLSTGSDPDSVTEYANSGGGTSFAAPLVTGALALLKQQFPTMGNHELVARLLATADKTGRYADSSIYGQGLLNINTALTMSSGSITVRLGSSLDDSTAYSIDDSSFSLSAPLSALRSSAASHEVEVYDSINTPFKVPLHSLLPEVASADALERLLAARTRHGRIVGSGDNSYTAVYNGMSADGNVLGGNKFWFSSGNKSFWFASGIGARRDFSFSPFPGVEGFSSPYIVMAEGGFAVGIEVDAFADSVWQLETYVPGSHYYGSADTVSTANLVASLASLRSTMPWRFSVGMLREGDTVLGGAGSGAFAGAAATTWYSGLELARHHGAWSTWLAAHAGMTDGGTGSSLWQGIDTLYSSSWAAGVARHGVFSSDDAVTFRVTQSLRVESGSVRLRLPERRDRYGNLYSTDVKLSAKPGGREIDMALSWHSGFNDAGSVSIDIGLSMDAEHNAANSSRLWSGIAWIYRF